MLKVARGMVPLEWGQDISRRRRSSFSAFKVVRKAVIGGAPEGCLYVSHEMDGSRPSRQDNAERLVTEFATEIK